MSVPTFTHERNDGLPFAPDYTLTVDFEVERGRIVIEGVHVKFAGGNRTAALGPMNFDRGAIEQMCRGHLETMQ